MEKVICNFCHSEIKEEDGALGDVRGYIACPSCMGHVAGAEGDPVCLEMMAEMESEEEDEELDWDVLVNEYLEQEKMYRFEGDDGIKNLNKVAEALGYEESPFRYGSPLERFLSDNPGAQDAIIEWITNETNGVFWRDNLLSLLEEKEDENEEE